MIAAIVLAAGAGSRFGSGSKPLARRDGRALVDHAIAAARAAAGGGRIVLVTGKQAARVAAHVRSGTGSVRIVRATDWRDGIRASLRAGTKALRPIERAAFIFLADMPAVPHDLARRLIGRGGARPFHRGKPGHPVFLDAAAIMAARAGAGGPKAARRIAADRRCRFDIDHPRRLHRRIPTMR